MSFLTIRYLPIFSFGFSALLAVAGVIFAYRVSPLRDATFQPNSGNAGSLLSWMQGMTENYWLLGANLFALLLSTNIVLIAWHKWVINKNDWLLRILMIWAWVALFGLFWIGFVGYLMWQWLID